MQRGFYLVWLSLLVFCFSQKASAACDPKFSANPVTLPIAASKAQNISLRTLLSDPQVGEDLDWGVFGSPTPPSWLTVDKTNEKLTGTAPLSAVGAHRFNLAVQCRNGEQADTTQVILQVQIIPEWKNAPAELFLGEIKEGATFQLDLRQHVTAADNSTALTFTETGLSQNAPWLKLSANGTLSGVPEAAHIGKFRNIVFRAIHPSGGSASTFANGEVIKGDAQAPKWDANPLLLPTATQGEPYAQDLRAHVVHNEPIPLSFEKTSGPTWVTVNSSSGLLSGTPPHDGSTQAQVGLRVFFTDNGKVLEARTTAQFTIENLNRPPQWVTDPLELPRARTGIFYKQDLQRSVVDPDGDKLSFRIVDGPGWANLTLDGSFEGTPGQNDGGTKTWTAEVTDGVYKVRGRIIVTVDKTNAPPRWKADPTILPEASEDSLYARSLAPYVEDADSDPLTFALLSSTGRTWVTITPNGDLRGTPTKDDLGETTFRIRVSDGQPGHNAVADVKITVKHVNHAPYWVLNPIRLSAKEDVLYEESIANYAKDVDADDPLLFQKVSGENWLGITPQGVLKGTPGQSNIGENTIVVKVSDKAGASKEATVIVTVDHTNHEPQWTADPVRLPSAKEDALYSEDLKPFVRDIDTNEKLSFTILSGKPTWLNLTTDGIVTGVPKNSNLGEHSFKVRVIDSGNLFTDAT
ncbi:MAG: hypothetical protein KDD51_00705, partial [Bdellovibrionales bacterium]|nr:hypothetical protein [Bdellovibrionales bacterium]